MENQQEIDEINKDLEDNLKGGNRMRCVYVQTGESVTLHRVDKGPIRFIKFDSGEIKEVNDSELTDFVFERNYKVL